MTTLAPKLRRTRLQKGDAASATLVHVLLIVFAIIAIVPILVVVMNSFKTTMGIFGAPFAILTYIWTFNGFDIVYALNGSAPGPNYSTDILGTLFYRTFFGSSGQVANTDLGATIASVVFFIILVTTAAYFVVLQRRLKTYEL